jgi:hypothetical protein
MPFGLVCQKVSGTDCIVYRKGCYCYWLCLLIKSPVNCCWLWMICFFLLKLNFYSVYIYTSISMNETERESDSCLMPNEQYFSYIIAGTSYIWGEDNYVGFVLDKHAYWQLDFYSTSSLKQQSTQVDMLLYTDTLSRFWGNKSLLFLLKAACLAQK